jgi:hypothetical protein
VLTIPHSLFSLPSLEVWWPDEPESVLALLNQRPLITVHGCPDDTALSLDEYAFRRKSAATVLFDLTVPAVDLWKGQRRKCRQDINKALKRGPDIVLNGDTGAVFRLINDHIRRKRYRPPLSKAEWDGILSHGDVFSIWCEGVLISGHAVLVDAPTRARATIGGEIDRADKRFFGVIGPMNRLLHWHEMNYYKHCGVRHYDFGGVVLDPASPMYDISRFKLSFGGELVAENVLQLWRGALGRRVMRQLAARNVTRQMFHSVVRVGGRFGSIRADHEEVKDGPSQGGMALGPSHEPSASAMPDIRLFGSSSSLKDQVGNTGAPSKSMWTVDATRPD